MSKTNTPKLRRGWRWLTTALLTLSVGAAAQVQPAPFVECATPAPTPAEWQALRAAQPALLARAAASPPVSLAYVPISVHVVRDDDGSAGTPPADIYRALVGANERFAAAGVQFYVCGQIDYVDDSTYLAFHQSEEHLLATPRDVAGTLNMYFVRTIQTYSGGGACGYAYYPSSNRRRLLIACTTLRTVTHELGHAFNLIHTHDGNNSSDPADVELVDGSNCATAGDLVCDTPADPYGLAGAIATGCSYTGFATDPAGDLYAPDLGNLMSYWACQGRLQPSPQQMVRARGAYLTYYAAQLSCGAPDPLAPTNLASAPAPGGGRALTWTDRATDELGYFIERAVGVSGAYVTIGYTLAGGTAWTDPAPPAGALTYRVKAINASGAYSNTVAVTGAPGAYCVPVNANPNCPPNLARFIDGVRLTQGTATVFDNAASGCGDYTYFAADSGALAVGTPATLRVEWPSASPQYIGAWLDLNRDGDFADAGEQILSASSTASPQTVTFTVPTTVAAGPVRLRVRAQNVAEGPVTNPCTNAASGETEDYPLRLRTSCALAAPVPAANGPLCAGQTLRLTATNVPAGATYAWTGPNGFASAAAAPTIPGATPAANGSYVLTITANGCTAAASVTATLTALPAQPAALAAQRCGTGPVTLTPPAPLTGQTYRWYATATSAPPLATATSFTTPSLAASTTYYVSGYATAGACESARRAVTVTVDALPAPQLTAGGPTTVCPGGSVTLTATGAGAAGTYQFSRNGVAIAGATGPSYAATQAGTYSLTATTAAGCAAPAPTAVTVTVAPGPPLPTITRGVQQGDSLVLTSSALSGNQWLLAGTPIPGATTRTLVVRLGDPDGPYSVVVTNPQGCASAAAASVTVTITGRREDAATAGWRLTPNPVRDGWLTLEGPAAGAFGAARAAWLYDAAGRVVRTFALPTGGGAHRLDVRSVGAGLYLLRVEPAAGAPRGRTWPLVVE